MCTPTLQRREAPCLKLLDLQELLPLSGHGMCEVAALRGSVPGLCTRACE